MDNIMQQQQGMNMPQGMGTSMPSMSGQNPLAQLNALVEQSKQANMMQYQQLVSQGVKYTDAERHANKIAPVIEIPQAVYDGLQQTSNAMNILGELEGAMQNSGMQENRIAARLAAPFRGFLSDIGLPGVQNFRQYEEMKSGMSRTLIRALGEKGALSDGDAAAATKLLPDADDDTAEATAKLNALKRVLQFNQQALMQQVQSGGAGQQQANF